MKLAFTATSALCIWIILWSIGAKALDGMILVLLIVVIAAAVKTIAGFLPSQRSG
jgi:hypothetical protein